MAEAPGNVTQLLADWRNGDSNALQQLIPLVYGDLHGIANRYLRGERPSHTLQATALVHEAYLRLMGEHQIDWKNRAHFLGVSAGIIRNILVDHARARAAAKRGGDATRLSLDESLAFAGGAQPDLLAVNDALDELARLDPQQSRVVELRFFAGLTIAETAEVMGISVSTVKRDWILAKAWIYRSLTSSGAGA